MKSFYHFNQVFQFATKLNSITGPYQEDHLSYFYQKSGQSVKLFANLQNENTIIGKADGNFKINGFDIQLNFSTIPSFNCQVHKNFLKENLDLKASFASKKHIYPHIIAPHIKNCISSFSTIYNTKDYNIEGFFGIKDNNSISTLCSISDFRASVALRASITDKLNILEATFLSTKYGPIASIKGDISSFSLQKMKIGAIKQINYIQLLGLLEFVNRSFNFGIISDVPSNNLIIAMSGGYNHSKRKPELNAGFEVKRKNTFCGKINIDGTLEMMTKFSPTELVTVSLRSLASVKDKFNTLNFGWSLDFK